MNRKLIGLVAGGFMLGACTPAQTASYNLSNDSDNFRVMRRVVFVNGITDKYLLSIEGLSDAQMSTSVREDWLVLV